MRHLKRAPISAGLMSKLFVQGETQNFICEQGLPDGAKVVGVRVDPATMLFDMLIEHESFEPVEDDQGIPVLNIICRNLPKTKE